MTDDQVITIKFHAEKLALAAHALLVLSSMGSADVFVLRRFHQKELLRELSSVVEECGFVLVKAEPTQAREANEAEARAQ